MRQYASASVCWRVDFRLADKDSMSRLIIPALAVLLLVTSTLLGVSSLNNQRLGREIQEIRARQLGGDLRPDDLAFVPAISVETVAGDPVVVGAAPLGTEVLFFFNTTCQYCQQTLPTWKRIGEELDQSRKSRVLGVSLDPLSPTKSYMADNELEFPVVVLQSERDRWLYQVKRVPRTLVVDRSGRVLFSRIGMITDEATIDSVLTIARMDTQSRGQ